MARFFRHYLTRIKTINLFRFLTNRPFWVNLLAAVFLAFLLIFLVLQLLGMITRHGEYLRVPSVLGKKTDEAVKFLESKGFDVNIVDSVYTDTAHMGIVLKQSPDPNSTVKVNRTIYLTVNRLTLPLVDMPALEGKTLNFALYILDRSHLKLGDTIYKPDFMKGSVLEQQFKGKAITPGTKIPWGSAVDLVVGKGLDGTPIPVPSLLGMTYSEARAILDSSGIGISLVVDPDVKDTLASFIYKQSPPKLNENKEPVYMQSGQIMDLWISAEMKVLPDSTQ